MLGIIASNFLKIKNGWTVVQKYTTSIVYLGTHFFPQFLEKYIPHFNECNILISLKEITHPLNGKEIDNSMENLSDITNGHQNY